MTQNDAIREYYIQRHACQDMLVPNHKVAECLEFCHENFEVLSISLPSLIMVKNFFGFSAISGSLRGSGCEGTSALWCWERMQLCWLFQLIRVHYMVMVVRVNLETKRGLLLSTQFCSGLLIRKF